MAKSRITSKNQTTVPREVRERLGVGPSDVLQWQIVAGGARVVPATWRFLERRGMVHVSRGSVTNDVRRAHRLRSTNES